MRKVISVLSVFVLVLSVLNGCNKSTNDSKKLSLKGTANEEIKFIPNESLIYENANAGYYIKFPESWKGWFGVSEISEGCTAVRFIGKSKTGSIATNDIYGGGLIVFYIVSDAYLQNSTMDNCKKIGEINGEGYYYCTSTGSDITSLLTISDKESAVRKTAKYKVDKTEIKLASDDWEKWNIMEKDIDKVLDSFSNVN